MRKATFAALAMAAAALCGARTVVASNDPAASGRLFAVDGGAVIQRSVDTHHAAVGSIIGVGDSILTTDTGIVQWQMSDTSIFALAPESGFKINKYALPNAKRPTGVASYTLLHGAIHTVTGNIGKNAAAYAPRNVYAGATARFNPANLIKVAAAPSSPYGLKTAFAVITAQGADFIAVQSEKALKVLVNAGVATVCTIAGCESPKAGEGVTVNCESCKPSVVSSASLGLDSVAASLTFNLKAAALARDTRDIDVRDWPLSATQACRTVIGHLEGWENCGHFDGVGTEPPVSPN